jgi:hypothetical protein
MATVSKVKEAVKESLLGTEEPEGIKLSAQTRATFLQHARKDEESGELVMAEEEFVNAIAPKNEDYVSSCSSVHLVAIRDQRVSADSLRIAQNQARTVCNSVFRCR